MIHVNSCSLLFCLWEKGCMRVCSSARVLQNTGELDFSTFIQLMLRT